MTSSNIRSLVRRHNAHTYLLITLVSFSTTVIVTRLFLTLTGFPKIGSGDIHIAHLLWGGLLLFISAMLVILLANRWMYVTGALLSGIGVGLFIDEIGKFITQNNDYFYPLAIPIIYAFFLMLVIFYLQVNRPEARDARAEMYRALEMFDELLDRDLSEHELSDLKERLSRISTENATPDVARLAQVLLDFLASGSVQLAPEQPGLFSRIVTRWQALETKWIGQRRLKFVLAAGLALTGLVALAEMVVLLTAPRTPGLLESILVRMVERGEIRGVNSLNFFFIRLAVEGTIGLVLLIASILLILGQDRRGNEIGYIGLLLSLTVANLLIFYFDQFGNIALTLVEVALLLAIIQYRQHYLPRQTKPH